MIYTIFNLREVEAVDILAANTRMLATPKMRVMSKREVDLIWHLEVIGTERIYTVGIFYDFGACECEHWKYSKTPCRHIAKAMQILDPIEYQMTCARGAIEKSQKILKAAPYAPQVKKAERFEGMPI